MGSDQKKTFLAIALSGIVLVVWQMLFAPKPVVGPNNSPNESITYQKEGKGLQAVSKKEDPSSARITEAETKMAAEVKEVSLSNKDNTFTFNSLLAVKNTKNKNAILDFYSIVGERTPFKIQLITERGPKDLLFEWEESTSESKLIGKDSTYGVNAVIELRNNGKLNVNFSSSNAYRYRFIFHSSKKELQNRQTRKFLIYSKDVDRYTVGDSESGEARVKWFGLDFNFHIFTFVFQNKQLSKFYANESGYFILDTINPQNSVNGGLIFSKKDYDGLSSIGDKLELSVDFGLFDILAVPIMRGLQFFYKYIPNYGIAIILLTLLIRMLTFPLQYKSFKSMKKMQKVQPELAKIKEKFKDDPQRMQKETMDLFRRAGANPLGGCLPLILQMPIFFAFYQVLYESVELLGAPFFGWISDLSEKDPYYVLPILMALSIFLQQKFQPSTTADPNQKKIMMLMPFIFGFIMLNVSSGLVLYIFVSTLFGIIQQYFVYRTTD